MRFKGNDCWHSDSGAPNVAGDLHTHTERVERESGERERETRIRRLSLSE